MLSSHCIFTALDLASITSLIYNWVLFLLWFHPFILSGVISPLIFSSILGTYSLEKTLMLGKIEGRRRERQRTGNFGVPLGENGVSGNFWGYIKGEK